MKFLGFLFITLTWPILLIIHSYQYLNGQKKTWPQKLAEYCDFPF
jgi:hypothetical protein